MVSTFLTYTCAKFHWAVLDTMFLLIIGPGSSLSYGIVTSDSQVLLALLGTDVTS